ncbi:MAG: dihydroxyacetone kinase subunit DhaK [Treponema sp.]|nr:dihydroxyacetone kinase subunit DhaK [Treponema sp.]
MKKFINKPENIVHEMCMGIVMAHPELEYKSRHKIIKKRKLNKGKVSLISGGGSGHEPAHAGFVGTGMLDAAVCGDVFASPSQMQVYQAIRETASGKGTLLIIKNYSGDMMNFKNAAFLAQEDGISVDFVKVDDDIAVQDSLYTVGRRGVAGTVFVHKIAGAAAEKGCELAEVKAIAEKTIANVKSIGIALTSCTVPAKGTPTFELAGNEAEYGVGIHGEPGIRREGLVSANEMIDRMLLSLCDELCIKAGGNERVAVLVNGFGATPLMELYLLNSEIYKVLSDKGVYIVRSFAGNYMTSIDMAGASVSILKLDEQLEGLLNAPCNTPALKISGPADATDLTALATVNSENSSASFTVETPGSYAVLGGEISLENLIYIVDVMCECAIKNEIAFCELDSYAGDGDLGMSLAKGFKQLKHEWKTIAGESKNIGSFLDACSLVLMEHCGGTSGPIWGSAFRAAGKFAGERSALAMPDFAVLLQAAVAGIQACGERSFGRGAVVGDKTLIDALIPCTDTWIELSGKNAGFVEAFSAGAQAAVDGAKRTERIAAKMGRAGTVGERSIGHPDAGAHALAVIFTAVAEALKANNQRY